MLAVRSDPQIASSQLSSPLFSGRTHSFTLWTGQTQSRGLQDASWAWWYDFLSLLTASCGLWSLKYRAYGLHPSFSRQASSLRSGSSPAALRSSIDSAPVFRLTEHSAPQCEYHGQSLGEEHLSMMCPARMFKRSHLPSAGQDWDRFPSGPHHRPMALKNWMAARLLALHRTSGSSRQNTDRRMDYSLIFISN